MIQTICDRCKNPITSFDYVELNYLLYHEFYNTGTIVEGKTKNYTSVQQIGQM